MECNEIQSVIDGYYDGELDLFKSLEIEQHIKSCEKCSAILNNYKIIHNSLRDNSFYYTVPSELKDRLMPGKRKTENKKFFGIDRILNWRNTSFALIILLLISLILLINPGRNSGGRELIAQLVNSHLRSLVNDNLTDVLSSDKHTVKPWFNGKINFSPPVYDLRSKGFPLAGGRIDYINNKQAAVLVYNYNKHIINLYISVNDIAANSDHEIFSRSGYNIIHWIKNGMDYWVISDLNLDELKIFNEEFVKTL